MNKNSSLRANFETLWNNTVRNLLNINSKLSPGKRIKTQIFFPLMQHFEAEDCIIIDNIE